MIASIYLKGWAVPALSSVCVKKLDMHTWYLSSRHIPLAMFSDLVEEGMKSDIARALLQNLYCPAQMESLTNHEFTKTAPYQVL